MLRTWQWVFALGLLLTTLSPSAWADETTAGASRQRAAEMKRVGDDAMDQLRYAEAIAAYTTGYSAYPDPALLYNRGRAHQARGEFAQALADFERFRDTASEELLSRVPRLDDLIGEVRAQVATLKITCNVKGATVRLNGERIGQCPIGEPIVVSEGEIDVEVGAGGYRPYRRRFQAPGGEEVNVEVRLSLVKKVALLRILGPSDAEVFVDGKSVGRAPVEHPVSPGRHKVVLRRPGYREAHATVVVSAGEDRVVEIEPRDRKPITSRWWFWTSIGVGVAAGVATAALLTEKQPGTGSHFSPGNVSSGLVIRF